MITFDELWSLLRGHGSSGKRAAECAQLWEQYSPEVQQLVSERIRTKLQQGKFVHYDPVRAMEDNSRPPRVQTLSYGEYYKRYGTTEERDGWKMVNPTGQKVEYIKRCI